MVMKKNVFLFLILALVFLYADDLKSTSEDRKIEVSGEIKLLYEKQQGDEKLKRNKKTSETTINVVIE